MSSSFSAVPWVPVLRKLCPSVPGQGPERLNLKSSECPETLGAPMGFTGHFVVFIPLSSGSDSAHRIPIELTVSFSLPLKVHLHSPEDKV